MGDISYGVSGFKLEDELVPTRKMKKIFKWWWANLPSEEQERIRESIKSAYAAKQHVAIGEVKKDIETRRKLMQNFSKAGAKV